ncbi:DNA-directed RNA polymerase II subunit RPB1 [Metarhizium guizhouense ARSEF 977]|uniref:DNA-directed RNA polymerase II subunit RPB1 n=1 Tax=Metarhizium guizhouense (strain ARSEF 977) TaxID=1276136 RepID=A0A0B4HC76_METGA|nr:DNA-directed RNA polymerase II subunit RPB1 [Metarhizium guizhouense ARSEF 977]
MDASALLTSQGWRGKGHSLHKTDNSIGLAKPLLLNRKDNRKGIGTTSHFTSDQWWLNAFDEQLKGLETSKEGKVKQTVKTGKLNAIEKGSLGKYSLYTSFVRGGFLEATLPTSESSSEDESGVTRETSEPEAKTDKRTRKEEKRRLKEEKAARRKEKEEKRLKKEAKRQKEEDAFVEARGERTARKEEKRRLKEDKAHQKAERRRTKEERRARKEAKRREHSKVQVACC